MINITNNLESKNIDYILKEKYGIPEIILMENAAREILENIYIDKYENYIIVAGPGNNGGDGLALARLLDLKGKKVKIICPFNKTIHYNICKNMNIEFIDKVENADVLIDAIFGVGIEGEIKDPYYNLIKEINSNKGYKIISIDLPTPGILADEVLMLSSFKEEMLYSKLKNKVLDIGINKKYYIESSNKFIVDEDYIKNITIKKDIFANKGDFGKVAIYAKNGAALLSVGACIKSGAGYTFLLSDTKTVNANLIKNPECINYNINEKIEATVYAIGPSIGTEEENLKYIIENIDKKLLLDADALNLLSENKEIIEKLNEECIITPHALEFSRLTGFNLDYVIRYPFEALKRFKTHYKGVIILKGKNNIVYDGNNYYIINNGNSKMANAGMGDTLTGIVASYKAQGYNSLNACIIGLYKQATLGSKLSKEHDVVNPSMIINEL